MQNRKYLFINFIKFYLLIVGLFSAISANAATLNITSTSDSYSVGNSFQVYVVADSKDQALNAIDGAITFPHDKLEVISVSKEGSILSLWTQEPIFSNSTSSIAFSGVALNPGYTGSSGKILGINFKVKKSGNAAIVFSSGSILANDGMGTNILTGLNSKELYLGEGSIKKTLEPEKATNLDIEKKPQIIKKISSTVSSTISPVVYPNTKPYLEKDKSPLFNFEIIKIIKLIITYAVILVLLLFILIIIYFIFVSLWRRVILMRLKFKDEVVELNDKIYLSARMEVDKLFSLGDYADALSRYIYLQSKVKFAKQTELNDRIAESGRLFLAKENFKKAQSLITYDKWFEIKVLLEEGDCMSNTSFIYHEESKKLFEEASDHIAFINNKDKSSQVVVHNKLLELENLLEKTKSDLASVQSVLFSEQLKNTQNLEENNRLKNILKERDVTIDSINIKFENKLKEKEVELENLDQKITSVLYDKKYELEKYKEDFDKKIKEKSLELENIVTNLESNIKMKDLKISELFSLINDKDVEIKKSKEDFELKLKEKDTSKDEIVRILESKLDANNIEFSKTLEGLKNENLVNVNKINKLVSLINDKDVEIKKSKEDFELKLKELENVVSELENKFQQEKNIAVSLQSKIDKMTQEALQLDDEFKQKEIDFVNKIKDANNLVNTTQDKLVNIVKLSDEKEQQLTEERKNILIEKNRRLELEEELRKTMDALNAKGIEAENNLKSLEEKFKAREKELELQISTEKEKNENFLSAVSKYMSPK